MAVSNQVTPMCSQPGVPLVYWSLGQNSCVETKIIVFERRKRKEKKKKRRREGSFI